MNGELALAEGALASGVGLVASYPGSPGTGTVEELAKRARERDDLYVEWSSNEKVALEMAIGASIAGCRALFVAKSVGLNAAIDPLMTLNLTGVHGGLVILLGDDPGAYGSQNDQDSRPLAPFLELPLLEPAGPADAHALIRAAFAASERFRTAVILRQTRASSQLEEELEFHRGEVESSRLRPARETWRFVPAPSNAVAKHRALHATLAAFESWAENLPLNRVHGGGPIGVVAAGFAARKLREAAGPSWPEGVRRLELSSLFPLPKILIERFLDGCRAVLVLEETEPFIEERLKALAFDAGLKVRILGAMSGHLEGREGELFRWQIQEALTRLVPGSSFPHSYRRDDEAAERPSLRSHCTGCGYGRILDALDTVATELGQKPFVVGDPGCLVTVADRLDAKFAMGSAVAVAQGLSQAGLGERAVAIFGDSSFFHTALPALVNAVHNRSDILMIVLDNAAALTTGSQPHPGVDRDVLGRWAPAVDLLAVVRACGVPWVEEVAAGASDDELRGALRRALEHRTTALVAVRLAGPATAARPG